MTIAIAALLTSVWAAMGFQFTLEAGDFTAFYVAGVIARNGQLASLHDEALQERIQRPLVPHRPQPVYFPRPHVYAALLAPLGFLPFRAAYGVWIAALGVILLACWRWTWKRFGPDAVLLPALFPPAVLSIAFGQDPVVWLGVAVLSYWLHEKGRFLTGGFVLGLMCIKPHLVVLVPVVLLTQRRWRQLAGFALAGLLEACISLALAGWSGAMLYVEFLLRRKDHLSPTPERMMNVGAIALNLGIDGVWFPAILTVVVLVCVVRISRGGSWWQGLAAALLGSLLVAPHTYLYDSTLLILPALLIHFQSAATLPRVAATAYFTPFPSLLQLAGQPWTVAPSLVLLWMLVSLAARGRSAYSEGSTAC